MFNSKKLDRYNDDYYLNIDSDTVKRMVTHNTFEEITSVNDWSLSFFGVIESGVRSPILLTYNGSSTSPNIGLSVELNNTSITIRLANNSVSSYSVAVSQRLTNSISHVCINYNSLSNTVDVYVNSVLEGTINNFSTFDFKNIQDYSFINGFASSLDINNYSCRDLCTFDRGLSIDEISYIYKTQTIPLTAYLNNKSYYPINNVSDNIKENTYAKSSRANSWNGGYLFSDKLIGDGYIEAELDAFNTTSIFGFSSLTSPVTSWNFPAINYGVYNNLTGGTFNPISNGGVGASIGTRVKGDIIKIERIGSVVDIFINNVLLRTYTGVITTDLSPTIIIFSSSGVRNPFTVKNVKLNGVLINNIEYSETGDNPNTHIENKANLFNPSLDVSNTSLKLLGWTDLELGIPLKSTATTFKGWNTKTNYIPNEGYETGLNMISSQSLTINGLTVGDKLVVNYDELGITKQDVVTVNAINYNYSNLSNIKVRLITVLKEGFYANDKVYKTIFNNGILRSGIESSYTEVVNAETDLKNPIDTLGVLSFTDLSMNNRDIIANGWSDLTDLQNSID